MSYDVIVIGGGMIGTSIAWWTARDPDFDGRIAVIERDPTYEFAATSRTNSCIRQQFGTEINIRISQFGAEFICDFKSFVDDPEAPGILFHDFGYLYLAGTEDFAETLRGAQRLQARLGAGTRILTPEEIAAEWPFFALGGIVAGSHNPLDEGYFDGATLFEALRRKARALGVTYLHDEVVDLDIDSGGVAGLRLSSGTTLSAGTVVVAAGTRTAALTAGLGLPLPIEPRRRYSFVFAAAEPLPQPLPLTIDPSGVHVRSDGANYLAGCPPDDDPAVDVDDFAMDHGIWEEKVWPLLATRIPAFDRLKLISSWVGHYDYNTLDQNAVLGRHPEIANLLIANGFSGHGLQQSPAVGRGLAELIVHGAYRSLDLSPLGPERIAENRPLLERAVI